MTKLVLHIFSKSYWIHFFSVSKAIKSLLSALGILWLIVETTSYFAPSTSVWIKNQWYIFLITGFVWMFWEARPRRRIRHRLPDRDTTVEICIDDIFNLEGAFVIPTNTTFDTDINKGTVSPHSVQGQFTRTHYDNDIDQLDSDLDNALNSEKFEEINGDKIGKTRKYQIGTVARLTKNGKIAYFLAVCHNNQYGNPYGTFDELKYSLVKLWRFIELRGRMEPIIIGLAGTKFVKLSVPREVVAREIIDSFVKANTSKKICEKLIIAIYPKDYYEHKINFVALGEYLEFVCRYTQFK